MRVLFGRCWFCVSGCVWIMYVVVMRWCWWCESMRILLCFDVIMCDGVIVIFLVIIVMMFGLLCRLIMFDCCCLGFMIVGLGCLLCCLARFSGIGCSFIGRYGCWLICVSLCVRWC